jgi:hypothetical protein
MGAIAGVRPTASGHNDRIRSLGIGESHWELYEDGTSSSDISELLGRLYSRIRLGTEVLKAMKADGCKVILRLVMYLSPGDEQGAGFVVSEELLNWINEVGVDFVDVDQYIIE